MTKISLDLKGASLPQGLMSYPMMKDSGVEWLGQVPVHWEIERLKNWVSINELVLPENTDPEYTFDYLDIGSVETGRLAARPERIQFGNSPSRARRIVRSGDTIVSTVRTYLKAVWHASHPKTDLIASTGFAVLTPRGGTLPRFVSYLCQSDPFTNRVTAESVGIAYPAIAEARLERFEVCIPSFSEQAAIVRFLSHADRYIRRYIGVKEKLLSLLEEYRQAIIHQVVTGQLDVQTGRSYPAYKRSGVEWLGKIPKHWDVRRLQNVGEGIIGLTYKPQHVVSEGEGVLVLRASNVLEGQIVDADNVFVECSIPQRLRTLEGDILLCSRSGSRTLIGKNAQIGKKEAGVTFGAFMTIFRSPHNDYLHHVFNSKIFEYQSGAFFTSTVNQLTLSILHDIRIPWPPVEERREIVACLRKLGDGIAVTRKLIQQQIELAHEYLALLIADVVSGKLDVREAAARLPEITLTAEEDWTDAVSTVAGSTSTGVDIANEVSL